MRAGLRNWILGTPVRDYMRPAYVVCVFHADPTVSGVPYSAADGKFVDFSRCSDTVSPFVNPRISSLS